MNRLAATVCLCFTVVTAGARWDAAVEQEDVPRCPEHRALLKQVELMRLESAKPREWTDRDRGDRLKAELASLERALNRVEELYSQKLEGCRAFFLSLPKDPYTQGVNQGYFTCLLKPVVDDDVVRAVRRVEELERRLKDRGLPTGTRDAFRVELQTLNARLDREVGLSPLYLESDFQGLDGGVRIVPQPGVPGRKP